MSLEHPKTIDSIIFLSFIIFLLETRRGEITGNPFINLSIWPKFSWKLAYEKGGGLTSIIVNLIEFRI